MTTNSGLSSNARRQQARASSNSPRSFKALPRLLLASTKSGLSASAAVAGDCFGQIALDLQDIAKIVVGLSKVRL